jgi:hypothetical protein
VVTFERPNIYPHQNGKVEMAGMRCQILSHFILACETFGVAAKRQAGQCAKGTRGEQHQRVIAVAPTIANMAAAFNELVA